MKLAQFNVFAWLRLTDILTSRLAVSNERFPDRLDDMYNYRLPIWLWIIEYLCFILDALNRPSTKYARTPITYQYPRSWGLKDLTCRCGRIRSSFSAFCWYSASWATLYCATFGLRSNLTRRPVCNYCDRNTISTWHSNES